MKMGCEKLTLHGDGRPHRCPNHSLREGEICPFRHVDLWGNPEPWDDDNTMRRPWGWSEVAMLCAVVVAITTLVLLGVEVSR